MVTFTPKKIDLGVKLSPKFIEAVEGAQAFDRAYSEFMNRYITIDIEIKMGQSISEEDKAFYEAAKVYLEAIANNDEEE